MQGTREAKQGVGVEGTDWDRGNQLYHYSCTFSVKYFDNLIKYFMK